LDLQSQWGGIVQQTVASTPATSSAADAPSVKSAAPAVPVINQAMAPVKCNWTEHTSPDGYNYYYNSVTGESRVRFLSALLYCWDLSTIYVTDICLNELVVGETWRVGAVWTETKIVSSTASNPVTPPSSICPTSHTNAAGAASSSSSTTTPPPPADTAA